MKKKTAILVAAGLLLVSGNVVLTLHKDSKVSRTSYITKWAEAGTENLTKTLKTAGVVIPAEEHPIYYNDDPGGFKEFYVKKGDSVEAGTTLYEYTSDNIDSERRQLESDKEQLDKELVLIDEQIKQLEYLQSVSGSGSQSVSSGFGGTTDSSSSEIVSVTIEKEIYEKEREKTRVEGEIDEYEDRILALNEGDELTKDSEVSGKVKEINYDLKNPIITIISDTPKVSGTFVEEELKTVEEGMEAYITSDQVKEKLGGTVTRIFSYPEDEPTLKKKSQFPFEIELDETGGEEAGFEEEAAVDPDSESAEGDTGLETEDGGDVDTGELEDGEGSSEDDTEAAGEEDVYDEEDTEIYDEDNVELAEDNPVIHGSHVNVTIVTDRVENAVTVADKQIKSGSYIYVITPGGKIEKRSITQGLEVNGRVQIEKGLKKGETVVSKPSQVARQKEDFITPLRIQDLSKSSFKEERKMDLFKAIGVGFLKR
ncbi:hypothetical protein AB1K84_15625 [Mesobacillus foraminis]|uniref:hypothetical protein n=1 Tax=Mesobacillus foraminis TaxID=279826 RepID=UPI0039A0AD0A